MACANCGQVPMWGGHDAWSAGVDGAWWVICSWLSCGETEGTTQAEAIDAWNVMQVTRRLTGS